MYWHESMGRSETESFRGFISDFCSGYIVHLETRVTEDEEGIFVWDFGGRRTVRVISE